jgi:threonylcarbamoyladenosine tRNA methylthiotransferase CDKAL1
MQHLPYRETTTLKVLIKNYGCSSNTADGEVLAGCLAQAGFQLASSEAQADVLIYNTCAVKGPTENRIIDALKHAPKDKKIIVAGCLPKISFERLRREVRFDGVVGPAFGKRIVDVVVRVLAGETVVDTASVAELPRLGLPRQSTNPVVSIVPINYGCLGSCAYCCVVFARGHLQSYSIDEICERVQSDYASGAREFWVTSQDTACYGRDLGTNLAKLLEALNCLEGDFRVRVGMMTPNWVVDMQERLIGAFRSEKVFKFLHLPVQSGDDSVLRGMCRFYTAKQFKRVVDAFRAAFPDLTLATDVIVGFPGESDLAFENTLALLEEVKPDVVNVSKFFARPKTAAWKMRYGLVEKDEIKRRSAVASALAKRLVAEQNQRWVGWSGEVLVDERGKFEGSWVGRNFAYKPVAIQSKENLLGKSLQVRVVEACGTYLKGEVLGS